MTATKGSAATPAPASASAKVFVTIVREEIGKGDRVNDLEVRQLAALSLIHDHPGWSMSEVGAALDIHKTAAARAVDALVECGLATKDMGRGASRGDQRCVKLHLTRKGSQVHKQIESLIVRLDPAKQGA